MTDLSQHIKTLLFRYDCVIVPGFGAFVAHFIPAKIHPVQHKFHPPSKAVSFNEMLQVNDGLLAHHCSRSMGITYQEALAWISEEVKRAKLSLQNGVKYELEGLGSFFNDGVGNVQFTPSHEVNFSMEAYGLTVFQSLPIERSAPLKVVHTNREKEELSGQSTGLDWSKLAKYSAAAAVVSILALTTVKLNVIDGVQLNTSSLNPFVKEKGLYQSRNYTELEESKSISDYRLLDVKNELPESYEVLGHSLKIRSKKAADKTAVAVKDVRLNVHVVGGCFSVKTNAERFSKKLRKKGFEADIIGKHNGLYVVSYQSFSSKEEARIFLKAIKGGENPQAWLLKK